MKLFHLLVVKRIPLLIFLLFYLAFSLITYKDYGSTIDEEHVYLRGKLFYNRIRGNDPVLKRDFLFPTSNNKLPFYNSYYAASLYTFNDNESLETYHLLNLLFATLIFIAVYELLLYETKSRWFSLFGPIFLFFTPRFLGDIPSNPKDVPFAVMYFISFALIYIWANKHESSFGEKFRLLIFGLFFGLTASLRVVGYSIYVVYSCWRLIKLKSVNNARSNYIAKILVDLIIIGSIGFLVHIVTQPYVGADPFNNFMTLMKESKVFPWEGSVLIFGREYTFRDIPGSYIPIWLAISTPLYLLTLGLFSTLFILRNKLLAFSTFVFIVNLMLFIVLKPVVYDGIRHALFLLPQLVVMSVLSLNELLRRYKPARAILFVFILINLLLVISSYNTTHPYEFLYFNEIVGGLKGAQTQFETDYWGLTAKETAEWFGKYTKKHDLNGKVVGVYGNTFVMNHYLNKLNIPLRVESFYPEKISNYDFVTCWTRWHGCSQVDGIKIGVIERDGVTLNSIYKTK